MADAPTSVRLDKWLWAARFYKTRGTAAAADAPYLGTTPSPRSNICQFIT